MLHPIRSTLALAAALSLLSAPALAQSTYQFVEIKPLAADAAKSYSLRPVAVNNNGTVVGEVFKQTGSIFKLLAFRFEPDFNNVPTTWSATGAATELKRPSMPSSAGKYAFAAKGLNNTGQVVGHAASKVIQSPVTWKQGTPSFLSSLTGQAKAINDQGLIAGHVLADQREGDLQIRRDRTHAAVWRSGKLEKLHPLVQTAFPQFTYSTADDVAPDGRVSITAFAEGTDERACLIAQNGQVQALSLPEGDACREARFWPGNRITAILNNRCFESPCSGQTRIGTWLNGQLVETPTTAQLVDKPVTGLPAGLTVSDVIDISDNGRMLVQITGATYSFPVRYGVLTPKP